GGAAVQAPDHGRNLPVTLQRAGHRLLGRRIGQPITPIAFAQHFQGQRSRLGRSAVTHAACLLARTLKKGSGGPVATRPARSFLLFGREQDTLQELASQYGETTSGAV